MRAQTWRRERCAAAVEWEDERGGEERLIDARDGASSSTITSNTNKVDLKASHAEICHLQPSLSYLTYSRRVFITRVALTLGHLNSDNSRTLLTTLCTNYNIAVTCAVQGYNKPCSLSWYIAATNRSITFLI